VYLRPDADNGVSSYPLQFAPPAICRRLHSNKLKKSVEVGVPLAMPDGGNNPIE
jgi:hypothetical protein